jgi:hypothetical protein
MEWKDLQPFATIIAAIIGGAVTAIVTLKLQDKKRNDDLDLKAFDHSLTKRLKEFEQKLIGDNSYLAEKGKNEAIKEDLEEINRKLESIKSEYVERNELLRWQLSKKATLHKLQAEKEFEVYSKIWDSIVETKFAVQELRPIFDTINPDEPAKQRWQRRYKVVAEKAQQLLTQIEKQRPFYPNILYAKLHELLTKVHDEFIDFEFSLDDNGEKMSREGYKTGHENLKKIIDDLNQVCDLIRSRVSESE